MMGVLTFLFLFSGLSIKYLLRHRSEIMMILQEILGIQEHGHTKKQAVVFAGIIAIERAIAHQRNMVRGYQLIIALKSFTYI